MAETGTRANDGGNGGDRPRVDEVEIGRPQIYDQSVKGVSASAGAREQSNNDGNGGHAKEVGGVGVERRTPEKEGRTSAEEGHTPVHSGVVGPRIRRLDSRGAVKGLVITEGGFIGAGSRGSDSSSGDVRLESLPRGKGVVTTKGSSK